MIKSILIGTMAISSILNNNIEIDNLNNCKYENHNYEVSEKFKDFNKVIDIYTNKEIEDQTISIFIDTKNKNIKIVDNF